MNGNGEARDRYADAIRDARNMLAWDTPAPAGGRPDGTVAELAARISATRDRAGAALSRAGTTDAFLCPPSPARDPELVQIHAEAGRFFQTSLTGSWVPGYLADRGLAAALLHTSPWKIGYAPANWTALTRHLRGLGRCDAALLCSGLVTNGKDGQLRDRFHDRLMIPLRAEDGIVVGFIGRRHPGAGDDRGPKYLNSPETEIFTKGQILAGLAEGRNALRAGAQPVLVEGPLDAIAVSVAAPGQFTGITPCGTALTGDQVAALARTASLREYGLRVATDGDPAGRKAAVRAHATLSPVVSGVTAVLFPGGADPASILQDGGRQALARVLTASTCPLADLVVDARIDEWARGRELTFAELQMGALRAAAAAIAAMSPDEVGPQAARLCALYTTRYDWKSEDVNREVFDAIEHHYQASTHGRSQPDQDCHPAGPAFAVVRRATAPSRSRQAAASAGQAAASRVVRQSQYLHATERG